jgi:hypothetical protein
LRPSPPLPQRDPADARPALAGAERANLVNWMAASATRLGLGDDVLFSAVACVDELRLPPDAPAALTAAAACLWLAAKWALGGRAPPASALAATLPACGCGRCAGCGGSVTAAAAARRRLLRAEAEVLSALDYGSRVLRRPTAETFLRAALPQLAPAGARPLLAPLAALLAEQALLESALLSFRPSAVAGACLAYAAALTGTPLAEEELAAAVGAPAAGPALDKAVGVLRAVHSAVGAAAAAGNPYAATLRWLGREPAALRVPPVEGGGDARLGALAAAAAGGAWRWVLPGVPRARAA